MISAVGSIAAESPPTLIRLAAHPVRWRLLRELARSDRAVWELTQLIDEPQNLVSYHLRQLRGGGLVSARQSSADRRDTYYAIDLFRCQSQLQAAGGAMHPGLSLVPAPRASPGVRRSGRRTRVLFLCTGNSTRSQIAEALLQLLSDGNVEAVSAGSHPKPLHPNAVRVMGARGIDLSSHRPKHLDEFLNSRFDIVITLCDRVREVCPDFRGHPQLVHWSVPDPALETSNNRASYSSFERTAAELETRISFLLHMLSEPLRERSTHAKR